MPKRLEDNPAFLNFGSENGRPLYGRDVYSGYRYYDRAKDSPLYHTGHGLSYTTFEFVGFDVETTGKPKSGEMTIVMTVKNTGKMADAPIPQAYASQQSPWIKRPPKELKSFKKVYLEAVKRQSVEMVVPLKYATSYWDEEADKWICEKGAYNVLVRDSGKATALAGTLEVEKTTW